ncbi:hypothetical protein LINPERHAP2_LOCUS9005 [Linum perenne]
MKSKKCGIRVLYLMVVGTASLILLILNSACIISTNLPLPGMSLLLLVSFCCCCCCCCCCVCIYMYEQVQDDLSFSFLPAAFCLDDWIVQATALWILMR